MPRNIPLLTIVIRREYDMLLARYRARQISQFLGFSVGDTTRITTAVSEVVRNAYEYAGGGTASFAVERGALERQELVVRVSDEGGGIADVDAVMADRAAFSDDPGIGIRGSRVLMDRFTLTSAVGAGTTVEMAKELPFTAAPFVMADAARLTDELAQAEVASPVGELHAQNQALLNTLQEVERLRSVATSARERAEAAQLVAERSLVVRERFMALTTHELRTPLNAIIGYMELLQMELAPVMSEKQSGFFARVQKASQHLLGVTNDFLDMAQGDAGSLKVNCRDNPARHVISEAAALVMPQATARDVNVNLSEAVDRVTYYGDVNRVRQVLVNLLGNAVSFSPVGGTVEIIAEHVAEPPEGSTMQGGPWSVIRVEDSGPGIPLEKVGHVFEPFVQLSSDGQATRKGSGLGLTVSRQLALLMGGDLTAASSGAGATFSLWLPGGRKNGAPA